jgi:hypothetical protein
MEGGKIRRSAYTTRRGVHVKSSLITDRGARGKWTAKHGPGIGPLKEGPLTKLGYHSTASRTTRRTALRKAVKRYGPLSTFRKLNAIATYGKRTTKTKSKTYKTDRNWVKKTFL